MDYVGNIFRPPSEANNLILQVTIGCAHNTCTFCSMYKDKNFSVKSIEQIFEDIEFAKNNYPYLERVFLADGDALVLKNETLIKILDKLNDAFPDLDRISTYASPDDILKKTNEELKMLKDRKLNMFYIGAESGDDETLLNVKKGVTKAQIIDAIKLAEKNGILTSVTFISGLAGNDKDRSKSHALGCADIINEAMPSYASFLTLMISEDAPIYHEIKNKDFELLSPKGVIEEMIIFLEATMPKKSCVFRSNHASNYFSLKGDLPSDIDSMVEQLKMVLANEDLLKDENMRFL